LPTAFKTKVVMCKWAKLNFAVLVIGDNFTATAVIYGFQTEN